MSSAMAREICLYTDSHLLGGAELALFALLDTLDRDLWTPTLLHDDVPGAEPLRRLAAARAVRTRAVRPLPLGAEGARAVPAFVRTLRALRPAVFHAHLTSMLSCKYALSAAVLARVPVIVATQQLVPDYPVDRSNRLQLRLLSLGVGRYIAVSHDIARTLVSRFGFAPERVSVIHNSVALERFDLTPDAMLRSALAGGRDIPIVLTCARLDAQKGLDVLLRAVPSVPDARFVLAGEGPERAALQRLAAELGIAERVSFLGARRDVPELLAACDVVALPSRYEGSSLSVLEAMAAGRALLTSAIPGTRELVSDGDTALLVAPDDVAAVAAGLGRLLGEPDLRAALGARARERAAAEFSTRTMGERVAAVYAELLAGR